MPFMPEIARQSAKWAKAVSKADINSFALDGVIHSVVLLSYSLPLECDSEGKANVPFPQRQR